MFVYKKIGFSLFFLIAMQSNVNAEGVKMYSDKVPSAEEMGNILFSSSPSQHKSKVKMRSISFGKPVAQALPEPVAVRQEENSSIGLPIKFGYNSAEVLEESKPFLNEIGRMLSLPEFSSSRLVIEGHTDAGGSVDYNRYLSKRRAQSVKKYLRNGFNIQSGRLTVVGMGESQSLPGVDPFSAVNRRVQFRKAN